MMKKYITLLILCLLTVVCLPVQAMAAGAVDTSEKCTIAISFLAGEEKAAGVDFDLYRIADISSTADLTVTEKFEAYPVSYDINHAESWRNLAQTLSAYVVTDGLQPDYSEKTADNGVAYFTQLPVGVYLAVGAQYISGQMIYTPQSFIVSVPTDDINDKWSYDVSVDVKYDSYSENENFDLELLKIWKDQANAARPQEITVEIYCDADLYDTVVLNKENNWKYELKNLNRNSLWTVKEKSVAQGYTVSVEQQGNRFVLTNTLDSTTDTPNTPVVPPSHGNSLPQTGLLWWPVPLLLIAGLSMMIIGVLCRRGAANEN